MLTGIALALINLPVLYFVPEMGTAAKPAQPLLANLTVSSPLIGGLLLAGVLGLQCSKEQSQAAPNSDRPNSDRPKSDRPK